VNRREFVTSVCAAGLSAGSGATGAARQNASKKTRVEKLHFLGLCGFNLTEKDGKQTCHVSLVKDHKHVSAFVLKKKNDLVYCGGAKQLTGQLHSLWTLPGTPGDYLQFDVAGEVSFKGGTAPLEATLDDLVPIGGGFRSDWQTYSTACLSLTGGKLRSKHDDAKKVKGYDHHDVLWRMYANETYIGRPYWLTNQVTLKADLESISWGSGTNAVTLSGEIDGYLVNLPQEALQGDVNEAAHCRSYYVLRPDGVPSNTKDNLPYPHRVPPDKPQPTAIRTSDPVYCPPALF